MLSLKESLLSRTKDKVTNAADVIDNACIFGNIFKFKYGYHISSKSTKCISISGIKKLTKGLEYLDKRVERTCFDRLDKSKMLTNYILHINLAEWGFVDVDWKHDADRRKEFGVKLKEVLTNNGVFNKGGSCWINAYSFRTPVDGLQISFSDFNDLSGSSMFILEFELI